MFTKWQYYVQSIPTLLWNIRPLGKVLAIFAGLNIHTPFTIRLPNGALFQVRSAMDIWVIKETCLDRDYERLGVQVENGWTVIDIGGGLGDFAINIALEYPQTRVLAFEPFPESFELLQKNITLNGISNVEPYNIAVTATQQAVTLATSTGVAVRHSTTITESEGMAVESLTLAQIFAENQIEGCDLLKIDCEGCEFELLLESSAEVLQSIRYIALEYHNWLPQTTHHALIDRLVNLGFEVKTEQNPVHAETGLLFARNMKEL